MLDDLHGKLSFPFSLFSLCFVVLLTKLESTVSAFSNAAHEEKAQAEET